jgi:phosphoesterase RecJ-like protein
MRLWGKVLSRVRQNDRKITVSYVTDKDFEEVGAKPEDLTGVVDYINAVPDSYFSLLLTEFAGKIKGSLRTLRDDINLSAIAEIFGGGGHAKAAGFTIPGKLVPIERLAIQASD